MQSYREVTRWQEYERFFPEALHTGGDVVPSEEWWPWRGSRVHLDRVAAPDAPAKLLLVHGAGGYGRMLAPYARLLAGAVPMETVAPDLPGYGLTGSGGRPVDYRDWVDCVADLVAAERARDGRPVYVLGASVGGMLAYSAAARGGVAGIAVTCLLDPRCAAARERISRFPALGRLAGPMLDRMRWLDGLRFPMRWVANMGAMSNDPALNRVVRSDPCGGGNVVALRFLRTYLSSAPAVEPEEFTACPVLMLHPAADRWTPPELSLPFFERIAAQKRLVMLRDAGHMPIEEPALAAMGTAFAQFVHELAPVPPPRRTPRSGSC